MSVVPYTLDLLEAGVRRLSRPRALALGARLGDAMSWTVRSRRRQALENLEHAFGDALSGAERRRLVRAVFRHFGRTLVETLLLPDMVAQGLDRFVEHEGWHHLEQAVAAGKGALVFTGHFGNWELVALAQGARGIPMDVVGRPPDDRHLEARLERLRAMTGNRTISKREAMRPILRSLREGRTVGLVVDQNAGAGQRAVFVDFFGRPAATTPALAVIALKTGVPVIPVFGYPTGDRHRVVYHPPLQVPRGGDRDRDVVELTARATRVIEKEVRARPDLWLWLHNRWRTRPEAEAGGPETTGDRR